MTAMSNIFSESKICAKFSKKVKWFKVIFIYIVFIQTFLMVSFLHSYFVYIRDGLVGDDFFYDEYKSLDLKENLCSPKTKIGFLKTHKTASSTVQNIVLRYGYNNKLNFLFGREGSFTQLGDLISSFNLDYFKNIKGYEMPWHKQLIQSNGYDICAIHMRWNKTAIRHLLQPKSYYGDKGNALYFTILREPSSVFESLYGYYDLARPSLMNMNIHQYIEKLKTLDGELDSHLLLRNNTQMGLNQQLYDMGIKEKDSYNIKLVTQEIERFKNEFDFVMIAEMLEESLILLAQHLCWPLEWVAYISHNVRRPDKKAVLSDNEKLTLSKYQLGDELLYNEFRSILSKRIEEYGVERMEKDKEKLKTINQNLTKSCNLKSNLNGAVKLSKEYSPTSSQVYGYKPLSKDIQCKLISMGEIQALKLLRKEQRKRFIQKIKKKTDEPD